MIWNCKLSSSNKPFYLLHIKRTAASVLTYGRATASLLECLLGFSCLIPLLSWSLGSELGSPIFFSPQTSTSDNQTCYIFFPSQTVLSPSFIYFFIIPISWSRLFSPISFFSFSFLLHMTIIKQSVFVISSLNQLQKYTQSEGVAVLELLSPQSSEFIFHTSNACFPHSFTSHHTLSKFLFTDYRCFKSLYVIKCFKYSFNVYVIIYTPFLL